MPLEKLSRHHLAEKRSSGANMEYVKFLRTLKVGEGGRTSIADEGVSRQTVKARLKRAADDLGVGIKFHRSPNEEVWFEVVAK